MTTINDFRDEFTIGESRERSLGDRDFDVYFCELCQRLCSKAPGCSQEDDEECQCEEYEELLNSYNSNSQLFIYPQTFEEFAMRNLDDKFETEYNQIKSVIESRAKIERLERELQHLKDKMLHDKLDFIKLKQAYTKQDIAKFEIEDIERNIVF